MIEPFKLWGRKDIAEFFGVSPKTADTKIISLPSFPKPVAIPNAHKRWVPSDVFEWAKSQR